MGAMLPRGIKAKLRIGFTLEAVIQFRHKRLCTRADLPIRKVAQLMKEEVLKVQPQYKDLLVPHCVALMYCPEGHGCGAYPSRKKVEELIKKGKEKDKPFELD